jgi:hypothetical protein
MKTFAFAAAAVLTIAAAPAAAQELSPNGTPAQREAMARLSWMDGEWVGMAETYAGPGRTRTLRHTERIGPMLGGAIKVVEGRSYDEAGNTAFNAFAIISWDEATGGYVMRSYAGGHASDFPLTADASGFRWSVQTERGPIDYVTVHAPGEWVETGDMQIPGRDPLRVITLRLKRVGDSAWPAAGAVDPSQ